MSFTGCAACSWPELDNGDCPNMACGMGLPLPVVHSKYLDNVICCPHCGGDYLHHSEVRQYGAGDEDNPSSRSDGVRIRVECEMCPMNELDLAIYQHKGNTYLEWVGRIAWEDLGRDLPGEPA